MHNQKKALQQYITVPVPHVMSTVQDRGHMAEVQDDAVRKDIEKQLFFLNP